MKRYKVSEEQRGLLEDAAALHRTIRYLAVQAERSSALAWALFESEHPDVIRGVYMEDSQEVIVNEGEK